MTPSAAFAARCFSYAAARTRALASGGHSAVQALRCGGPQIRRPAREMSTGTADPAEDNPLLQPVPDETVGAPFTAAARAQRYVKQNERDAEMGRAAIVAAKRSQHMLEVHVLDNDTKKVRELLAESTWLVNNRTAISKATPVQLAVARRNLEIVEMLCKQGKAKPNLADEAEGSGGTAMHWVFRDEDAPEGAGPKQETLVRDMVRVLLEVGTCTRVQGWAQLQPQLRCPAHGPQQPRCPVHSPHPTRWAARWPLSYTRRGWRVAPRVGVCRRCHPWHPRGRPRPG